MLTKCPECELQVSDKASVCPHCGYPLKVTAEKPKKTRRRMRLPNGFGQISELKGRNLRNPFRAMITVGKDESGKPICKKAGVDEYAIKHMVGHAISDITESIYTDRSVEWLAEELTKLPKIPNMQV